MTGPLSLNGHGQRRDRQLLPEVQRPATGLQQRNGLPLELVRETPTRFRHQTPFLPVPGA
jgi:hypothetical protein